MQNDARVFFDVGADLGAPNYYDRMDVPMPATYFRGAGWQTLTLVKSRYRQDVRAWLWLLLAVFACSSLCLFACSRSLMQPSTRPAFNLSAI